MARRYPNPQLAKIHRNYSVEEAAELLDKHKNTIRQWIKGGLPVLKEQRPILILGRELRDFLQQKRSGNKCPLKPGEFYCLHCRSARVPYEKMAEYEPLTESQGNLIGFCPVCETVIYRRISLAKIEQIRGKLDITLPQALLHINERDAPSLNCDLR